jgi:eukaryotic-like serine/threonine-protein kinase
VEQIKGKYRLERLLGRGGMAEVFLGRTIGAAGFSHPVAIKRILAGCSADEQFQAMFVSEARLSARLSHSNVVSVLDFDADETGRLFLVMELVDGTDLDGLLRAGLLPLPVVLFITKEILRGLGHAHDLPISDDGVRGLVHRDVSPQNVLIAWDGAVKVSDFGIAKARAATHASASVCLKGKAAYMSPEQANGAVLDGRSDLFAAGVILWEMLCGASLFGRDSLQASLKAVLFDPIPSPRSRRPSVPRDIERVVMKLLARDREDRFPNADAAIAALDTCAAFPKDGRGLLSAVLVERLPDRAWRPSAGPATRLEKPALARGPAGAAPEETSVAPAVSRRPDRVDPYRAHAPRSRSRRVLPLALLGAATALTAGLAVGTAAHLQSSEAAAPTATSHAPSLPTTPASLASPAAPPVAPVQHRPPEESSASTRSTAPELPGELPELPGTGWAASAPAPPVRTALVPPAGSQQGASTNDGRSAPAAERLASPKLKARQRPTRAPASRDGDGDRDRDGNGDGIRVIDLGAGSARAWQ